MLDIPKTAVLDRYSAEFRDRVAESFHLAHASFAVYDTKQLWNLESVIKTSASCSDF